jgi:hypothetical protein
VENYLPSVICQNCGTPNIEGGGIGEDRVEHLPYLQHLTGTSNEVLQFCNTFWPGVFSLITYSKQAVLR